MVAHVTTRRKLASVYRYGSYRCSFATHKGPAVCTHSTGYRQERLEAALLAKFREAMTPDRRKSTYETTVDVLRAVFPQKHLRRRARPLGGPSQTRLFGGYEPSDGEVDLILTPKLRRS
jgi:hypothetical protein